MPQPSASTMLLSSLFAVTRDSEACSAFKTLPRSGKIACVRRSRPCLALPPAESPSTMNSSHSSGDIRGAVGQLARQVQAPAHRALARDLLGRRARGPPRLGRLDDPLGDGVARRRVRVQVLLEPVAQRVRDDAAHLRVVELGLGLALELRLAQKDAHDRLDPLADVIRGDLEALGRDVVRVEEPAQRLGQAVLKALIMGAAILGGDAVGEGEDLVGGVLGPLQGDLQACDPPRRDPLGVPRSGRCESGPPWRA